MPLPEGAYTIADDQDDFAGSHDYKKPETEKWKELGLGTVR